MANEKKTSRHYINAYLKHLKIMSNLLAELFYLDKAEENTLHSESLEERWEKGYTNLIMKTKSIVYDNLLLHRFKNEGAIEDHIKNLKNK